MDERPLPKKQGPFSFPGLTHSMPAKVSRVANRPESASIGRSAQMVMLLLLLIAVVWWLLYKRQEPVFPQGTRVLLITIDTLRPDALGYVAGRNDTPTIDALANAGVRFTKAISQVPLTLPSHTTMMTGIYPTRHGIHVNGQLLSAEIPTLAELFRTHGYSTAAFVSAAVLKKDFGLNRGFEVYDDSGSISGRLLQRRAPQTIAAAAAWIAEHRDEPWFVWVHLYDAHMPYDPPRVFWKPGPRGAYDGAVTYIDNALPALLNAAREAAPAELLTLLTADHGEAFGEHGEHAHGIFIYDTTTRVPMIVNFPGVLPPSAPGFSPRLVDITPTLLAGMGWKPSPSLDGFNLIPGLLGEPIEVPPGYVESEFPWTSYGWAPLHGLNADDWKLIDAPSVELYHLADDPGESGNQAEGNADLLSKMTAQLDRIRLQTPLATAGRIADAEILTKLQSLGYIGAGGESGVAPEGRPDPKAQTDTMKLIRIAEETAQAGEIESAFARFSEVLEKDPENKYALSRSGSLALGLGDLPIAIERLSAVLKLSPDQSDAQFALADALTRAKRYREALPHWLETVRLQPDKLEAWSNLGSTAVWTGDFSRAVQAYTESVRLAPNDPGILGNLGEALRLAGKNGEAVDYLIKAAQREGSTTRRASRIGVLLSDLGRSREAISWLAKANVDDDDYVPGQIRRIVFILQNDKLKARGMVAELCVGRPDAADLVHSTPALRPIADGCFSGKNRN